MHFLKNPRRKVRGHQDRGNEETNQGIEILGAAVDLDVRCGDRDGGLDVAAVGDVLGRVVHGHGCAGDEHVDHVANDSANDQGIHGGSHVRTQAATKSRQ